MKHFLISVICIFSTIVLSAQVDSEGESEEKPYSPTIGIGVGTIGFYGDLNDRNYDSPFGANPGFNVYIIQPLNDYLNVKFNFFTGEVREEERSLKRNVNFESDLRAGALLLEYNFDHFLPKTRKLTPFITTGIEIVEFNPKSDLEAFGGEPYNYWSDGSIRNVAENSPGASQSVIIQRDYSYETDIREAGFNNSTTYSERAVSIPVGVGVTMHLNDQFDFRFESVMHFTFSDYIDGITPKTKTEFVGEKKGNANNDFFYYNGVSLSYNFQKVQGVGKLKRLGDGEAIDYLATGNTEDFDGDGIIDLIDRCPNTPEGIAVDTLGCPVDTDGDGIADFKDEEINTEYPEFANDKGVEVTDEMMYESYMLYKDSSLEFAEVIQRDFTGERKEYNKYRIKVGEYNRGETPPNMKELLSLADLRKTDQGDKTYYTVGNYRTIPEATQRLESLKNNGFGSADIVRRERLGNIEEINTQEREILANAPASSSSSTTAEESIAFRVQIGAYKKQPTTAQFKSIPDLVVIQSGGYFRYMSGSFSDFNSAAKHKIKMVVKGYEGAFVVAYKNGERVPLRSVGVTPISSDPLIGK